MKPRLLVTVDEVLPRSNWRLKLRFHLVRTVANAQIVSSGTVPDTGHSGIHGGVDGRTLVQ